MPKLRAYGLSAFVPEQSQQGGLENFSLPAMICAVFLFCVAAAVASPAQSIVFTTLAHFNGTDGANSQAALVEASDGNFYGTTFSGGAYGYGVVFKITPTGTLTTLYSFCAQGGYCADGEKPSAGLVQASDGNFYGTTSQGGGDFASFGTIFKITSTGDLTTLHSFDEEDGRNPVGGLVQGSDGDFYGTTESGGTNYTCYHDSCGTVFKITSAGILTTLHSFDGPDGFFPGAGLVQASDGDFYGTTIFGGAYGYGVVFKITPSGELTTLHSFDEADGNAPTAVLVQASDGSLYGTTEDGGAYDNCYPSNRCGTIFKITPSGMLTTLHNFDGSDGYMPRAGLVQARDGDFYGTTSQGGSYGLGTVFKITPGGVLTTLHNFEGADGGGPSGGLVQATNGFFYGTTAGGGAYGDGTVFRLALVRTCATCRP